MSQSEFRNPKSAIPLPPDATDFDHLFTPDRLAQIDKAAAEIDAGDFFTAEKAKTELAKRRAEWIRSSRSTH